MRQKISYGIQKVRVNTATFSGVEIEPTLVNFFFGNNGTGKSTIAEGIKKNEGLTWEQGYSEADYSVLVFDKKFIAHNFLGFGNVPGVYTIGEKNAAIRTQIDEFTGQMKIKNGEVKEHLKNYKALKGEKAKLWEGFKEKCWKRTDSIRKRFPSSISGFAKSDPFAKNILQKTATEHSMEELEKLYDTATDSNGRSYPKFKKVSESEKLAELSYAFALLGQAITSSSNTDFARFVKAMNASAWLENAHENYHYITEGKCPYCQQNLPDDIEEKIASCFDEQYQADVALLKRLLDVYTEEMSVAVKTLDDNLTFDLNPKMDFEKYKAKLELLRKTIEGNIRAISDKIANAASIVELDDTETLIRDINDVITAFNIQIQENNDIVADKPNKKATCDGQVWEHIAFILADEVSEYNTKDADFITALGEIEEQGKNARAEADGLKEEISKLSRNTVSTKPTIDGINKILRDAGFQGFHLHEKDGHPNVYEVLRQNGDIAENLSEGELNFIAFLYFYHVVRGSLDDSGMRKDKIVVIDDPVSSMDSNALFIISALVRDMIQICHNYIHPEDTSVGGEFIRQIFILTHNTYFFKEISYNQVRCYDSASFFHINKMNNVSSVIPCIRKHSSEAAEMENYTPVQNSYAALWSELNEVTTVIPTLSVIRRILEYYFIQLCGYDGNDLRQIVLEKNITKLVSNPEDENADRCKYLLAASMLSYLSTQSFGYNDGMHFIESACDAGQCKEVFKLLFECLGQDQHYNKMMNEELRS